MRLRRLVLSHFRQHTATELEFREGLTGIVGPNGSGKSSIVEAIGFALFGSRAVRGRLEEARTRRAPAKAKVQVELVFEQSGDAYRVERTLDHAALYHAGNDEPLAEGKREVDSALEAVLGMTHEEFLAAYYTEQKGLEFLSGKRGAAERERFIVRMLGYNRLQQVQEELKRDRRDRQKELEGLSAGLGDRSALERSLAEEKRALAEVQGSVQVARAELEGAEKSFEQERKRFLDLEARHGRYTELQRSLEKASGRRAERVSQIERLKEDLSQRAEVLARRKEVIGVLEATGLADLALVHRAAQKDLEAAKSALLDLRGALDQAQAQVQREQAVIDTRIESAESARQSIEEQIAGFQSLAKGSPCPTCGQELGDSFQKVVEAAQASGSRHEYELKELRKTKKQLSKPSKVVGELQGQVSEQEDVLEQAKVRVTAIAELMREEEALVAARTRQGEAESDLEQLDREIEVLKLEQKELGFSERDYLGKKAASEAAARLLEVTRLKKVRLDGDQKSHTALVERAQTQLDSFDRAYEQVQKLRNEVRLYESSDDVLTGFRKHLNASLRPRLAELAGEYIADLTDGRYVEVAVSDDFAPRVVEDGTEKTVLSGGEEDILNLCLRLALSTLLAERAGQPLNLMILDEVFGSLDEQRRQNVVNLLEKLAQRFEQIVVITHMEDVKDGIEHLVYLDYEDSTGELKIESADEWEAAVANL